MHDPLRHLYKEKAYPAMSHPLSDPAVSAVAALLGGLQVKHPSKARILEIGCSSGHNLIPLAMRWSGSRCIGIDFSEPAIRSAKKMAHLTGIANVEFHAVDLREFDDSDEPFDYIIAHGFFSWVPDEVKAALLAFCQRHLAATGIATISFNAEPGWRARFPVIQKVRAIQHAGAADEMTALAILRDVTEPHVPEMAIIDDMLAKGPGILPFDDFAPINDPWTLEQFVRTAADTGLRWLGESDPAMNDTSPERTFHSPVLCRADVPLKPRVSWDTLEQIYLRIGATPGDQSNPILPILSAVAPCCVSVSTVEASLPGMDRRQIGQCILDGMRRGWIAPRIEENSYPTELSEKPKLNSFRLECARRSLPLIDAWHRPCSFPQHHYAVLEQMDGTADLSALTCYAATHCPDLDFKRWLRHLALRGMFS